MSQTFDNYRARIMRWSTRTGHHMTKDQVNCLVRVLQLQADDIPYLSIEPVMFAFYAGLKFERERSPNGARRHNLT